MNDCLIKCKDHFADENDFIFFDGTESSFLTNDFMDVFDFDNEFCLLNSAKMSSENHLFQSANQTSAVQSSDIDIFKTMFPTTSKDFVEEHQGTLLNSVPKRKFCEPEDDKCHALKNSNPYHSVIKSELPPVKYGHVKSIDAKKLNTLRTQRKKGGKGKVKNPKYALNSRNMQVFLLNR